MVNYIDFQMLNQPCIPDVNHPWSWNIYCRISFAKILFRTYASMFMKDIDKLLLLF